MADDFEQPETLPAPAPGDGDGDVDALRQRLAERDDELAREREARGELLQRVRNALIASDPDIEPGLVVGETLEEIEASFAAAQQIVARVRQRVEARTTVVPAGAPGRAPAQPASPLEKIRAGLRSGE